MVLHGHCLRSSLVLLHASPMFCPPCRSKSLTSLRSRCHSRNRSSRSLGVSKQPRLLEGAICRWLLRLISLTDAIAIAPNENKAAERSMIARRLRHAGSGRGAMSGAVTLPGPRDAATIVVR
jgi:hypothetical protein